MYTFRARVSVRVSVFLTFVCEIKIVIIIKIHLAVAEHVVQMFQLQIGQPGLHSIGIT